LWAGKEAALDDIRSTMDEWRKDCDNVRPHGAIGNKAPTRSRRPLRRLQRLMRSGPEIFQPGDPKMGSSSLAKVG
jgi:hypothetical protein